MSGRPIQILGEGLCESAGFLLVSGFIVPAEKGSTQVQIKVGIVSKTFEYALFFAAKQKGFYKNEGLDAEIIFLNRMTMTTGGTSTNQPFEENIFDIPTRIYYRYNENVITGDPVDDSPRR